MSFICARPLRYPAREYSRKSTQSIYTNETPVSPADLADLRRQTTKPQNSLNLKQPVFLCDIMQLAAFLSALSALSAGEYSHESTQSICKQETPISPADHADLRRQTTKPQNSLNLKLTVFLCEIMQPAAFVCVICVICGRICIQTYSINIHIKTPISPADLADLRRQTTEQPLPQTNCLSLRNNAACCIPLRDLRNLRENKHSRVLNLYTQKKPQYLPQISQIYADETQNNRT